MKIGVIKLGARISFSSQGTSGGTGEAISIIRMLQLGGADVTVFTKILSKDNNPDDIEFRNIEDNYKNIHDLNALVVINGTVQFYGGAEDPSQLLNYQIINEFKGKVFYIYCDPELTFKQVWNSVEKKPWASNWSKEQLFISKDITYISQPQDTAKVLAAMGKNEIKPSAENIHHYPFEKFPCLNEKIPFNKSPEVDLSYGGTMRQGRRAKKMIKFYFDHPVDISVEMFGKINKEDFNEKLLNGINVFPAFTAPVQYDAMLDKMNKARAHCVIGDPFYEQINDIPQRLYESIWSNVVTFIDTDMDKNRRVWANDKNVGEQFFYVNSKQELSERIRQLKDDTERKLLVDAQFEAVNFNAKEYCEGFVKLLA